EPEHGSEHQQRAVVTEIHAERLQYAQHDPEQHHHGEIGRKEQGNTLEHRSTRLPRTTRGHEREIWQPVGERKMKPPTGSASEGASGGLYRGRFAPSPTGDLHAGSIMAALGSWLFARRAGGEWLLRIEDLDPPREEAGAARRQLRMLAAMGLVPDGPVEYQSTRFAIYQQALDQLVERGLAFACHCSRNDLSAVGGTHRECVARRRRQNPAIRLRVPAGARVTFVDRILGEYTQDVSGTVGDFVLRRADGWWAYQLAVVVDDGAQRVTDVVRGADLLDSTPRQILLQRALGLPTPGYAHLP